MAVEVLSTLDPVSLEFLTTSWVKWHLSLLEHHDTRLELIVDV